MMNLLFLSVAALLFTCTSGELRQSLRTKIAVGKQPWDDGKALEKPTGVCVAQGWKCAETASKSARFRYLDPCMIDHNVLQEVATGCREWYDLKSCMSNEKESVTGMVCHHADGSDGSDCACLEVVMDKATGKQSIKPYSVFHEISRDKDPLVLIKKQWKVSAADEKILSKINDISDEKLKKKLFQILEAPKLTAAELAKLWGVDGSDAAILEELVTKPSNKALGATIVSGLGAKESGNDSGSESTEGAEEEHH
jgi:hypothetical protein